MLRTRVGYAGGTKKCPTYQDLGDHTEAVNVIYDSREVTFENLLILFWSNHNPTLSSRQQYMSIIFYHNDAQKQLAQKSIISAKEKYKSNVIHTEIRPKSTFFNAEYYHQKYTLQYLHPWLVVALQIQQGDDLIRSHACAKVNGFLSGHGSIEQLAEINEYLGLTKKIMEYVKMQIKTQ